VTVVEGLESQPLSSVMPENSGQNAANLGPNLSPPNSSVTTGVFFCFAAHLIEQHPLMNSLALSVWRCGQQHVDMIRGHRTSYNPHAPDLLRFVFLHRHVQLSFRMILSHSRRTESTQACHRRMAPQEKEAHS